MKPDTGDSYTIEDARLAIRGAGFVAHLIDPQEEETVRMARLAIREHERAEAAERRVADLEARAVRAEAAVGVLAERLADVEWRALPSIGQIHAHNSNGAMWVYQHDDDLGFFQLEPTGRHRWDFNCLDIATHEYVDIEDLPAAGLGEWRPCLADGTPCAWPDTPTSPIAGEE